MKGSQGKHDSLIELVAKELDRRGYQSVYKNTEYSARSCGEIDLWTKRDNYILLFEMKCNDTYKARRKAYEQMDRAERNCFPHSRVFKFYVYNHENPTIEWVKNVGGR